MQIADRLPGSVWCLGGSKSLRGEASPFECPLGKEPQQVEYPKLEHGGNWNATRVGTERDLTDPQSLTRMHLSPSQCRCHGTKNSGVLGVITTGRMVIIK